MVSIEPGTGVVSLRRQSGMTDRPRLRCSSLRVWVVALRTPNSHNTHSCGHNSGTSDDHPSPRHPSPGRYVLHNAPLCAFGLLRCARNPLRSPAPKAKPDRGHTLQASVMPVAASAASQLGRVQAKTNAGPRRRRPRHFPCQSSAPSLTLSCYMAFQETDVSNSNLTPHR